MGRREGASTGECISSCIYIYHDYTCDRIILLYVVRKFNTDGAWNSYLRNISASIGGYSCSDDMPTSTR